MPEADITIVGAGIIGLAIAAAVAREGREVFVIEKNQTFGQETSARNSQVIHAGIYYPPGSLRASTCVEGNALLYELCRQYQIEHKKVGKLIVATDNSELEPLEKLYRRGRENGARDLRMLDKPDIARIEPGVRAIAAILSPSTGVFDVHALMRCFLQKATSNGARVIYRTTLLGIEKQAGAGYRVAIEDRHGISSFLTRVLVNCAGLNSEKVAALAGIDTAAAGYGIHYCKGEYFKASGSSGKLVKKLVYPVLKPNSPGLGIHVTPSLNGALLLGPSARYVDDVDYSVEENEKQAFYESVAGFLPSINIDDITPEMAGIRPTRQGPGEDLADFIITDEERRGLPGFINLIGIESPGLTSSPAIARYVASMVGSTLGS